MLSALQSKVMMRTQEEGNADVVRLLVRTAKLSGQPLCPAPAAQHCATPAAAGVDERHVIECLLSSTAAEDVIQEDESRWLVVSDTFCPGDIRRYATHTRCE